MRNALRLVTAGMIAPGGTAPHVAAAPRLVQLLRHRSDRSRYRLPTPGQTLGNQAQLVFELTPRRAALKPTDDSPERPLEGLLEPKVDGYVDARAVPLDRKAAVGCRGEDESIALGSPGAPAGRKPSGRFAHDLFNGLHPPLATSLHNDVDRPPAIRLDLNDLEALGMLVELQRVVRVFEEVEDLLDGRWHVCVQMDACHLWA